MDRRPVAAQPSGARGAGPRPRSRPHPVRQRRAFRRQAQGDRHLCRRHDAARALGHRAADQGLARAFAPHPHRLQHVDEAPVPARQPRPHLDPVEHLHPLAVAHACPRHGQTPAFRLGHPVQPRAPRHRDAPQVIQRQRAAVVQLHPGVNVLRPAQVVADMGFQRAQRLPAEFKDFLHHAQIGVHAGLRCGPPAAPARQGQAFPRVRRASAIALLGAARYLSTTPCA